MVDQTHEADHDYELETVVAAAHDPDGDDSLPTINDLPDLKPLSDLAYSEDSLYAFCYIYQSICAKGQIQVILYDESFLWFSVL